MATAAAQEAWAETPGGFWVRFAAMTIDNLVIGIPLGILEMFLYGVVLAASSKLTPAAMLVVPLVIFGLALAANLVYYTWMTAAGGQTLGKKLFKLKVVRVDGAPMDVAHAFGRAIGYWVSSVPLLLGFLIAPFTHNKRALHDYVADSRVVRSGPTDGFVSALVWIIPALSCFLVVFCVGILAAVATPKFALLLQRSREGATKGNQMAIYSGVANYYHDHPGHFPAQLDDLLAGGKASYLDSIPTEKITNSNRVVSSFDGQGGWYYNNKNGWVGVNVAGVDKEGIAYKDYGTPKANQAAAP
jgi:uncharacterized RDD family membrane protein YckC